ncbi:unnamed protein product [Sphagnum balticum]
MRITLCSNNSDYTREEIQCEKEIGNLQSFVFMDLLNKDNIPFTTLLTIQEGYLKWLEGKGIPAVYLCATDDAQRHIPDCVEGANHPDDQQDPQEGASQGRPGEHRRLRLREGSVLAAHLAHQEDGGLLRQVADRQHRRVALPLPHPEDRQARSARGVQHPRDLLGREHPRRAGARHRTDPAAVPRQSPAGLQVRMRGLSFFGETLVNCYVGFEAVEEKVSRICLFNQESSELILGTSLGSIWKVDIFDDLTEPALSESGKEEESGREGK